MTLGGAFLSERGGRNFEFATPPFVAQSLGRATSLRMCHVTNKSYPDLEESECFLPQPIERKLIFWVLWDIFYQ
jgi:hypothetical protein